MISYLSKWTSFVFLLNTRGHRAIALSKRRSRRSRTMLLFLLSQHLEDKHFFKTANISKRLKTDWTFKSILKCCVQSEQISFKLWVDDKPLVGMKLLFVPFYSLIQSVYLFYINLLLFPTLCILFINKQVKILNQLSAPSKTNLFESSSSMVSWNWKSDDYFSSIC